VSNFATNYTVGGGGHYCSAAGGVAVTLSGSQSGISYAIRLNGSSTVGTMNGNGGALTSSLMSAVGTYTIVASNNGYCPQSISGSVSISTTPSSVGGTLSPASAEAYATPNGGTINLSGHTGSVLRWESNTGSGWSNINLVTTSLSYSNLNTTTQYRAVVQSGVCTPAYSSITTVTIYPRPTIVGSTIIQFGSTETLSAQSSSYHTYKWYRNGNPIPGATEPQHIANEVGTYFVEVEGSATIGVKVSSPPHILTSPIDGQQRNFHKVTTLKGPHASMPNLFPLTTSDFAIQVQYSDGLGRPIQQVAAALSPQQKDVIAPVAYDALGRASKAYLPYTSSSYNGTYRTNALAATYSSSEQYGFYQSGTGIATSTTPFAETLFDNSPLSMVKEQGAPGADWQTGVGHTVRTSLLVNSQDSGAPAAIKDVKIWTATGPTGSNYATGSLTVSKVIDENNNEVYIFTDILGRTILKRVQLDKTVEGVSTSYLNTYYVYDDLGRLIIQVPPKAVTILNTTATPWSTGFRDMWCFYYTYDERGRLVETKAPGIATVSRVYDNLDRLVLTQDGVLKDQNKWMFVKYDYTGRAVMSGFYINTSTTTRSAMQTDVNGMYNTGHGTFPPATYYESRGTTLHGYTNVSFPTANQGSAAPLEVTSVNYYDNYDFDNSGTEDFSYTAQSLPNENSPASAYGMATGTKKIVLGTTTWLYSYVFYDKYGRAIQIRSNNHLSSTVDNLVTSVYDFEGKLLRTKRYHKNNGNNTAVTVVVRPEYDHAGRVVKIYQQYDSQPSEQLVAQYSFNALGQMIDKKLHNTGGSDFLQSIDYRYNIRGWLTSINNATLTNDGTLNDDASDYFGMELAYNTVDGSLGNTAYYNGNVSTATWKGIGATPGPSERRSYKFTYDKSDRLEQALFQMSSSSLWDQEVNTLNEEMAYDNNGNILTLERKQNQRGNTGLVLTSTAQVLDGLTYTYTTGNQLSKVEDAGISAGFLNGTLNGTNEYTYDANGSMTADKNKKMDSVKYNEFGKVKRIRFADGRVQTFVYNGGGEKLTSKMFANTGILQSHIEYVGGFQYESGILAYQPSPEGRVMRSGETLLPVSQSDCASTTGFTAQYSSLTNVVQNGETYLKVSATGGVNGPGVYVTSLFTVQPGKKYVFRLKGYVQAGAAYRPMIYITTNIAGIVGHPNSMALPVGAANEDWVSYEFTTQATATQVSAGIFWAQGTSIPAGYEFYLNKAELIPVRDEYQYSISDHQGNTRVVFSETMGVPKVSTADMESPTNSEFSNYASVFRSPANIFDHTDPFPSSTKTYSVFTNGTNNYQIGPAKSYKVMPGDKVKIEAYAKYIHPTGYASNLAAFAGVLLGAFGAPAPLAGEVATASVALNNYGGIVAAGNGPTSTGPKAFVTILVFDKNYNLTDLAYEAIDPSAEETGANVPFDYMMSEYTVKEAGYVYMYVSNENPTRVDVYFDDIVMTHTPGNVIQYNEYYPFGMRTAGSWDRVEDKPMSSLQTGLIARLLFDGNGQDVSGTGNHATFYNGAATTRTHGRPEGVLLDGADDYLQINDNASLDFGANDFTIAIWVKKLAVTSAHDNRETIHKWNNNLAVTSNEWALLTTSDGTDSKVRFHMAQGSTHTTLTSPEELIIGNWYHLSVMRTGTMIKLYVNGVLKASANVGSAAINNVGHHVLLGRAVGGMYTNAVYDDLYIYGRSLTEDELRYLYLDKPELMANNYLYNGGSEYNGTNAWYETFYRGYDPALGRFMQVDPLGGKYGGLTPYNFAFNSPVVYNDPRGDEGYGTVASERIANLVAMGYAVFFDQGNIGSWGVFQQGQQSLANGGGYYGRQDAAIDRANNGPPIVNLLRSLFYGSESGTTIEHNKYGKLGYWIDYSETNLEGVLIGSKFTLVSVETQGGILDVTDKFYAQLARTELFYSTARELFESEEFTVPGNEYYLRLQFFASTIGHNRKFDIKQSGKGFSEGEVGTLSVFEGKVYNWTAYGNINYGYAARIFGFSLDEALNAAGIQQVIGDGLGNPDWSNWEGMFDEQMDTDMIKMGYNLAAPWDR
jgi:RHS repeat-associated protein